MRIISQDGTRDFPYDKIALILRYRVEGTKGTNVIVAVFDGKEYDIGYYHDQQFAIDVLQEIRCMPEYINATENENEVPQKLAFIILPPDE